MRPRRGEPSVDCVAPIAACLLIFVGVASLGFLGGYRLMQPRILPNPGLAAYEPPPATRLIPLPHKTDAPELAELPPAAAVSVAAQAEPEKVERKSVVATAAVTHKRPRPRPQPDPFSGFAYADGGRWGGSWASWGGGWRQRW